MRERIVPDKSGQTQEREQRHGHLALIDEGFESAMEAMSRSQERLPNAILHAADAICRCFAAGGKLLVCGNGGSAADAQHFVAELVGRFNLEQRPALPALSLTADSAVLTAWANDFGYRDVFARQVEAFGRPGDLLLAISTSGRSSNLVEALRVASRRNLSSIALLGGEGGDALTMANLAIVVPSSNTQRIQEVQILILHLLVEIVEEQLEAGTLVTGVPSATNGNGSLS